MGGHCGRYSTKQLSSYIPADTFISQDHGMARTTHNISKLFVTSFHHKFSDIVRHSYTTHIHEHTHTHGSIISTYIFGAKNVPCSSTREKEALLENVLYYAIH